MTMTQLIASVQTKPRRRLFLSLHTAQRMCNQDLDTEFKSEQENNMAQRKDLANAIRALSMDAVQKANSGHPGAPMGMADIAEVLWNGNLKHNPP